MSSTNALGAFHEAVFAGVEAAGDDFGRTFRFAGQLVDGDDGEDDAVFADVAAVFNNQVFDHVGAITGVDADAADVDASRFCGHRVRRIRERLRSR